MKTQEEFEELVRFALSKVLGENKDRELPLHEWLELLASEIEGLDK